MSAVPIARPQRESRSVAPRGHPSNAPQLRHVEIVSSRSQKRARPRLIAAIITVGGLFAILAAQLLLTIATSEGAYEISSLQTQQSELARDTQVLTEQLQVLDAPQHIAAEAQGMGMVLSASTAYLSLRDGVVLGTPVAATASSALRTQNDGSPLIPNSLLGSIPLAGAVGEAAATEEITGTRDAAGMNGSAASVAPAGIPTPNTH